MIRCDACGRFIGFGDIEAGKTGFEYTPDSEFTREKCAHLCVSCNKQEGQAEALREPSSVSHNKSSSNGVAFGKGGAA